jgi:hypothetical protein
MESIKLLLKYTEIVEVLHSTILILVCLVVPMVEMDVVIINCYYVQVLKMLHQDVQLLVHPVHHTNSNFTGEGIEEHTYEVTVDFNTSPLNNFINKSTCCEVTFYIGQCCRNGAITTGAANNDFFTTCMINICNIKKTTNKCNTSPQLSNPPIGFLCCNQAFYYNNGAIDTVDFDSFSYRLVHGIVSKPNNSVSYSSPFTSRYFITPYCVPPLQLHVLLILKQVHHVDCFLIQLTEILLYTYKM